jgi:hypothetical protein
LLRSNERHRPTRRARTTSGSRRAAIELLINHSGAACRDRWRLANDGQPVLWLRGQRRALGSRREINYQVYFYCHFFLNTMEVRLL